MKTMELQQYIIDTFTDTIFKGNPAAVCILSEWLSDSVMQDIAKENNLSETAFTLKKGDEYELRWFTPGGEIDLCGHATLGTAYVLLHFVETDRCCISFQTKSGQLTVRKINDLYEMDMPAYQLTAKGTVYDCVTRSFAPKLNVSEDPVCGSGHCHVIPLWAKKTGKDDLTAFQASERSGILYCHVKNDRVILAGKAVLYSKAVIVVPCCGLHERF